MIFLVKDTMMDTFSPQLLSNFGTGATIILTMVDILHICFYSSISYPAMVDLCFSDVRWVAWETSWD